MDYVTYDAGGALTGGYSQELQADHEAAYIEVTEAQRIDWVLYQANAARDGVELIVIAPPAAVLSAAACEAAIQLSLDALAREWGYDDIKSAATYVGDPHARFDAEGTALRNWRSATWAAASDIDAAVSAGQATAPADIAALLAALPPAPVRP